MFLNNLINSVRTGMLAVLLIVSFSTLAPARPVDRTAVIGVDLSQYSLPDGSLPTICFGNGPSGTEQFKHCDDCINGFEKTVYGSNSDHLIERFSWQQTGARARLSSPVDSISQRRRPRAPPVS